MALRLHPFPADSADVVSGWARTNEEVIMRCGRPVAPVPAGQINAWAHEDGVLAFGLYRDGQLVAYGELWVDDAEAEVELARLIVDPANKARAWADVWWPGWPTWPGPDIRGSSCGFTRTTSPHSAARPARVSSPSSRIRRRRGTPPNRSTTFGSALSRNSSQ